MEADQSDSGVILLLRDGMNSSMHLGGVAVKVYQMEGIARSTCKGSEVGNH